MCGVTTTFGRPRKRFPGCSGSSLRTSRAAPASRPSRSISWRASSSVSAEADESDRAAAELDAMEAIVQLEEVARTADAPAAVAERLLDGGQVTREHEQEGDRQVGDRVGVPAWGMEDRNALPRRQLE